MIRGVIFDLDNTLEEWIPHERHAEREIAEELAHKHGFDLDEFLRVFSAIKIGYLRQRSTPHDFGREVWFPEALAHLGVEEPDIDSYVQRYWEMLNTHVRLFPGVIELLSELKGRVKLGLLTDGDGDNRRWKEDRLKELGIADLFDAVVVTNDIGVNKPHPRCFIETAERLGVPVEECMMVGDKPEVDLIMAKQLGMTTVWTTQGGTLAEVEPQDYPYVDHVIEHITEVRGLLAAPAQVRHPDA